MPVDVTPAAPLSAVRRTLDASKDPRVARTRTALLEATHRLVERGDDTVSISDIVREAGVSRSSFYSHFAGLDELALYVLRDAFGRIRSSWSESRDEATLSAHAAMRRSQVLLVDHYVEHRALYAAIAALPVTVQVYSEVVGAMAEQIETTLDSLDTVPDEVVPRIAARYIAHAAVGLLDSWLRHEITASAEQLVDHLMALMPTWMSQPDGPGSATGDPESRSSVRRS